MRRERRGFGRVSARAGEPALGGVRGRMRGRERTSAASAASAAASTEAAASTSASVHHGAREHTAAVGTPTDGMYGTLRRPSTRMRRTQKVDVATCVPSLATTRGARRHAVPGGRKKRPKKPSSSSSPRTGSSSSPRRSGVLPWRPGAASSVARARVGSRMRLSPSSCSSPRRTASPPATVPWRRVCTVSSARA